MTARIAEEQQDLVACHRLSRHYRSGSTLVAAVEDVDCRVGAGVRVAVSGPSGSGKSTLLHLIAGLDTPTGGTVAWPGLGGSPAGRPGQVGVVFQGPSLLAPLDVAENTALPLLLANVNEARARERATEALAAVEVADLAGKLPEELSGGQAQRVAVARVLALAPPLILADEPTGQLDSTHAKQVIDVLVEVAARLGAGLVVATHDRAVADRLPCRWQMHEGRLTPGREARC
ncbi:MAG: ABC transporter ATP-binding protein [Streptosporangiaceae bacterium]